MPYHIAGIDVHKKMLAVAVADVAVEGDFQFERLKVGTSPVQLHALADWLVEREVEEVVMESTAQYWRPVWEALERYPHFPVSTLKGLAVTVYIILHPEKYKNPAKYRGKEGPWNISDDIEGLRREAAGMTLDQFVKAKRIFAKSKR